MLHTCAVSRQRTITLTVDQTDNSYSYVLDEKQNRAHLAPPIHFGTHRSLFGPPGANTQLIARALSFDENKIIFGAHGSVSAGTIYLTDGQICTKALTLNVADVSYVRKYHSSNNGWVAF